MTTMPSPFVYKKKVWTLATFACVLLCVYLFLIGSTIYNTYLRQRAEHDNSVMTAELSQLEFSYLAKEASITIDLASSMGFVEASNVLIAKTPKPATTAFVQSDNI